MIENSKHMPAAPDWLCNTLLEHLLGFLVHSFVFLIMVIDDVPVGSELTLFFFLPDFFAHKPCISGLSSVAVQPRNVTCSSNSSLYLGVCPL